MQKFEYHEKTCRSFDSVATRGVSLHLFFANLLLLLLFALPLRAQWQDQSVVLKPGWNAVYLHVDASHVALDDLIVDLANPISELWLWRPPSTSLQYHTSPQQPIEPNSQWAFWNRSPVVTDSLKRAVGNAAYLVLNTNTTDYTWTIRGKPLPPRNEWTVSGLNFVGFPTPADAAPNFDAFLRPAPEFYESAEIYRYVGGDLGTNNPDKLVKFLYPSTQVKRGQAFWMRSGTAYNRYFGPVEISIRNSSGIEFADKSDPERIRLKNLTKTNRTMRMSLLPSASAPAGQIAITSVVPLLLRGALDITNGTYTASPLVSSVDYPLAAEGEPGSEIEIVMGADRSSMNGPTGSLYAGILRFADTDGLSEVDVAVSATVADQTGLWVGGAEITQVGQYLKSYPVVSNQVEAAKLVADQNIPQTFSSWSANDFARNWKSVFVSRDGSNLLATVEGGLLYQSRDSGLTWNSRETVRNWKEVAGSVDGARLVAAGGNVVFVSGDYGTNWAPVLTNSVGDLTAVTSSGSGEMLSAVSDGGFVSISRDYGATWTLGETNVNRSWRDVASSADGSRLAAVVWSGKIYTSEDSGTNWLAREGNRQWAGIACSDNGSHLIAIEHDGNIFTSTDYGTNWVARLGPKPWRNVASSADGRYLVALESAGKIYTSSDFGTNWLSWQGSRNWVGVSSAQNGKQIVAVASGDKIYIGRDNSFSYEKNTGLITLNSSSGNRPYLHTGINTNLAGVRQSFPFRLILHRDAAGITKLLQRVYLGAGAGNGEFVIATQQAALDPTQLGTARRISAIHFPFTHGNAGWSQTSGSLALGSGIQFSVNADYNAHSSNPFLHTFHPDHDNLSADFESVEAQGIESYSVTRAISLNFSTPAGDFVSRIGGAGSLTGNYAETMTFRGKGSQSREFKLAGRFQLNRISPVAALTSLP
jgi:hypothetical protein